MKTERVGAGPASWSRCRVPELQPCAGELSQLRSGLSILHRWLAPLSFSMKVCVGMMC